MVDDAEKWARDNWWWALPLGLLGALWGLSQLAGAAPGGKLAARVPAPRIGTGTATRVCVTDKDGKPVADALVVYVAVPPEEDQALVGDGFGRTGADGCTGSAHLLYEGTYQFKAVKEGYDVSDVITVETVSGITNNGSSSGFYSFPPYGYPGRPAQRFGETLSNGKGLAPFQRRPPGEISALGVTLPPLVQNASAGQRRANSKMARNV